MANAANEMAVFERVVARGSFAAAAHDVGLSASAVSKLISRLESRLGVRLINRTTRRLALTAEGVTYLRRSREILAAIEAAEAELASERTLPRGHLRVHAPPVLITDHVAQALPAFLEHEIERVITAMSERPGGGLTVMADVFMAAHRAPIITLAARHRLPVMYSRRIYVVEGGLMGYGTDVAELFKRAAGYVDSILKGADPGELPVQRPTKFELALNLKTAKALGLTVPPSLLARADEVIE